MRIIGHLDMDAFFAAVEERDKPHLRGRPIVVGADPEDGRGRGVVSTANYAARRYGIHSAMPIRQAWELAEAGRKAGGPAVAWIMPEGRRYGETSRRIMSLLAAFVPALEQTSVDEAYLDLGFTGSFLSAGALAGELKAMIREKEKLTSTVGIGPNKLVAKIASGRRKPDGLTVVTSEEAEKFMEPLSVRDIPGIGPKAEASLARHGVRTVAELKAIPLPRLSALFGKWGTDMYLRARGVDESPLLTDWEAKSVGEQETFDRDTLDPGFLSAELKELSAGVFRSFRDDGFRAFGRVVVTVRFADFTTFTRSRTLKPPADSKEALEFESLKLFLPFLDRRENPGRKAIRLLGVRVEKLTPR